MHDFRERENGLGDHIPVLSAAARNDDANRLGSAFHRVENDIFLQHAVLAKCRFSGFKNVKPAQFQLLQEVFPERAEIGAIAKAPGRDADELAAGNQQALDQSDEAGIEVAGSIPTDRKQCLSAELVLIFR